MGRSKHLPKVLTPEEQTAILAQLRADDLTTFRNRCMVRLMLDVGLRCGEVVAIRPEHLNVGSGKLIVREGKGAKDRELWLPLDLNELIESWLERRPPGDWLFPTSHGTKVQGRYMRVMVKRCAERAGVQEWRKVSPHTLRHSFATDFLNATGHIRLLQEILGHSDVSTTMIYTHLNSRQIREAMQGFRSER